MDSRDVWDFKNAIYVFGMAVNCMVRALGMHAENMQREALGQSMAYGEDAFVALTEECGIHHNGILTTFEE